MAKTTSDVEVCNLALDLLRHNQLMTSIETPTTEEEALGSRWYDQTRRALLRMFPWNFARKRASLPRVSVDPTFGYSDAYRLPNDYIGFVFIGEDYQWATEVDHSVEGNQILLDNDGASSLYVCYIYDIVDVAKFDPIFTMLLAAELAYVFGNAITGLNKSIKGIETIRDRWEMKARAKNGHENPPKVKYNSPLLNSRRNARRELSSDGVHLFS